MPVIDTPFSRMFDIDYPIVGAPMFLVSKVDLVVAVSEAGGMGSFPTPNYRSLEELDGALTEIKSKTDKPFAVNIPIKISLELDDLLDVIFSHEAPLVITSLGNPLHVIERAHQKGTKVFCDVINSRQAAKAAGAGVDGLVAVTAGAGGHGGTISPFVLIPLLARKFGLPVLAAGGIVDGAGMAAAFALGACAAYMGTRFIASTEAEPVEGHKQAIIAAGAEDIVFEGHGGMPPANFIRIEEGAAEVSVNNWKDIFSAGQNSGLIDDVISCREIIERTVATYFEAVGSLPPAPEHA